MAEALAVFALPQRQPARRFPRPGSPIPPWKDPLPWPTDPGRRPQPEEPGKPERPEREEPPVPPTPGRPPLPY